MISKLALQPNRAERGAGSSNPSPGVVGDAIRAGLDVADADFDRFLPFDARAASGQHWTPICAAARAAAWISELGIRSVVDIGSGAGKFCVAAALAGRCEFVGVEQRGWLVSAARSLARAFEVSDRVRFVEGTFGAGPALVAEAYYFYNSFGENLLSLGERLDEEVELSVERYRRDVAAAREHLLRAPVGTYLLTYNGFGGRVPPSYDEVRIDRELPNVLRAWHKTRDDGARDGADARRGDAIQ